MTPVGGRSRKKLGMDRKYDVEALFDEFVRTQNGVLLREQLKPDPGFENADYLFPDARVLAELKCLQVDHLAHGGMLRRFHKALSRSTVDGREVDLPGQYEIEYSLKLEADLRGVWQEPLRRMLKKANRQLRETARHLGLHEHSHVVLVNNDGLLSLSPGETVDVLVSILGREFSSTDAFVYFTTNIWARDAASGEPLQVWAPNCSHRAGDRLQSFLEALGEAWFDFFGKKLGQTLPTMISNTLPGDQEHIVFVYRGYHAVFVTLPPWLSATSNMASAGGLPEDVADAVIHPRNWDPATALQRKTGGWLKLHAEVPSVSELCEAEEIGTRRENPDVSISYEKRPVAVSGVETTAVLRIVEFDPTYSAATIFVPLKRSAVLSCLLICHPSARPEATQALVGICEDLEYRFDPTVDPEDCDAVWHDRHLRWRLSRGSGGSPVLKKKQR